MDIKVFDFDGDFTVKTIDNIDDNKNDDNHNDKW